MNELERLYRDSPDAAAFARGYLDYLTGVLARLDDRQIAAFVDALLDVRARGGRIFFLGNGGSASTASHFANDISIGSKSWEKPFRAISLTDNVAVMTAIANDSGYEEVFVQQLRSQLHAGDLVVAISVSGNSPNILAAVRYAAEHGAVTVGLTGFDGGQLRTLAEINVHVQTNAGEYAPAEDVHIVLDHIVGSYLQQRCAAEGQA